MSKTHAKPLDLKKGREQAQDTPSSLPNPSSIHLPPYEVRHIKCGSSCTNTANTRSTHPTSQTLHTLTCCPIKSGISKFGSS